MSSARSHGVLPRPHTAGTASRNDSPIHRAQAMPAPTLPRSCSASSPAPICSKGKFQIDVNESGTLTVSASSRIINALSAARRA